MNIVKFIGILISKLKYIIALPLIAVAITFLLVKDMPKQYTASTTVYTGITSNSGLDVTATKVDKLITQNEYNNIMSILKSTSLFEEVGLRLMAQHLSLSKADREIISEESYQKMQEEFPAEVKKLAVKGNAEATFLNLKNFIKQDDNNFVYRVLNYTHPFYSVKAISNLRAEQVNGSDLFKLTYESRDAGICYNTLKMSSEVFIRSYGQIKKNLKSSAVKYFQDKLQEVSDKLNAAENKLLNFNIDNTIINYYEQTKQVTTQHEEIELRLQTAKMNYEGSTAVLKKIEDEVSRRYMVNLKNVEILNIRSLLVECNNSIARAELNPEESKNIKISDLYLKKQKLETNLGLCLDSIYRMESSTQGIESQKVLGEWLEAVKNFETSKAMYKSMQDRQVEFMMQFKRYAPLGANIKRIEREINVYENEYLNILNNLNIALQNEQNSDIISNMRIIDPAKYPISSMPSKKKLYLIIAALITLIFYIASVLIIELLDNRIKTPTLLSSLAGLETAGAFSFANNKTFKSADFVTHKASAFITEKINAISTGHKKPFIIQILSIWDNSGKKYVADSLVNHLTDNGFDVKIINLSSREEKSETNKRIFTSTDYNELIESDAKNADYVIVILPHISEGIDNSLLASKADISLMLYNAGLTWTSADIFNTEKIKGIVKNNLFAVLTYAQPENLEEIYGEIPKKRSKIRILTKNLIKRFVR